MRFSRGEGSSRRAVTIEIHGRRMVVATRRGDGADDCREKVFDSADEARLAGDRLSRELIARGYVDATAAVGPAGEPGGAEDLYDLADPEDLGPVPTPLPRVPAPPDGVGSDPGRGRSRRRPGRPQAGDEGKADPRTLVGLVLTALAGVGLIGLLAWLVTKEPSLVGTWRTSRGFAFTEGALIGPTRVVTFRRDGSVTMILEDQHVFLDGTYSRQDGRLRLRFDRGNSWELGDFDLSDMPEEEEFSYEFKGGWLLLRDEDGGAVQFAKLRDGSGSRVARGGPPADRDRGADDPAPEPGPHPLRGRWVLTAFERDGEPSDGGPSWVAFDSTSATFGHRSGGSETTATMPIAVEPDERPRRIDFLGPEGPRRGFYAVTGDVLTIVLNDRPGGDRPSAYGDTDVEADRLRVVLRRDPDSGAGGAVGD